MSHAPGRDARHPSSARTTTRDLLICAALGALTAMAVIALSSVLGTLAAASPPLYSLVGGYTAIAPLLALRLTGRRGAATITALCCALIAWPFSPLGVLLLAAVVAPAVAMDLLFGLRRRIGRRGALWLGAGAAALVIFALSLPIISPDQLTTTVVLLTLVGRLASYAIACALSGIVARALHRAGVRPPAPRGAEPQAVRGA
ncbi:hypothetical protein [Microbacterium sp. XT11]|uniref:hypothetical protein n=1 Tax=Microbacterium sp. XT11 TaxID=367477 RepID=UPI000742D854|nr:hypothetical protein [Microbacterium sp. XT11]ALX65990.1 hypothetical protein AB663_000827 [Microbacterium sp. XT11]